MTLREVQALLLLYRSCADEAVRRRVLALVPGLDELVEKEEVVSKLRKLTCDCTAADVCPQGRVGYMPRCAIWVRQLHLDLDDGAIDPNPCRRAAFRIVEHCAASGVKPNLSASAIARIIEEETGA